MENVRIEVMAPVINKYNNVNLNQMVSRRHTSQTDRRQQFGQELMQNLSSGKEKKEVTYQLMKKTSNNYRSSSQLRVKRSEPNVQVLSKLKNKLHQNPLPNLSFSNSDFLNTKVTQISKQGISQDVITAMS